MMPSGMKPQSHSTVVQHRGVGQQTEPDSPWKTPNDSPNIVAFIGHGVEFRGVIKYQGSVRIDGHLDGEIHANGTLYLGEQGMLSAKIQAKAVISKGQITGDIHAEEKVHLLAPAVMEGAVQTPSLLMEEGVLFNGTIEMRKAEPSVTSATMSSAVPAASGAKPAV